MKCRCHPNSPFLWRNNKSPTVFVETHVNQYSKLSQKQSQYVERERNAGRDISHIAGISKASHAARLTDFKRFAVYSFARPKE